MVWAATEPVLDTALFVKRVYSLLLALAAQSGWLDSQGQNQQHQQEEELRVMLVMSSRQRRVFDSRAPNGFGTFVATVVALHKVDVVVLEDTCGHSSSRGNSTSSASGGDSGGGGGSSSRRNRADGNDNATGLYDDEDTHDARRLAGGACVQRFLHRQLASSTSTSTRTNTSVGMGGTASWVPPPRSSSSSSSSSSSASPLSSSWLASPAGSSSWAQHAFVLVVPLDELPVACAARLLLRAARARQRRFGLSGMVTAFVVGCVPSVMRGIVRVVPTTSE
jgi:hypothetical protein